MRIVLLVDLDAEERFEDVLEGDHAGECAELVDHHREVLVRADEVVQGVGERRVLGHDVRLAHELADADLAAVLAGGLQDIATTDDAHDTIRVVLPDRQATVRDARIEPEHVGDGEVGFDRRDDRSRREHLRDRDVVEADGVGDEVALGLGDLAFAGRGLGEAADIRIGAIHARLFRRSERVVEFPEGAKDLGGAADELERGGDAGGEGHAEMHAHLAREHDRQPGHHEGDGDEGQGREHADLPADIQAAQEARIEEEAAQQGAHADEGGGKDLEGGEGVALVAARALDRDGGLGVLAAEILQFGMGEGRNDPGHERDTRRAAVEEDEDRPEIPSRIHVLSA